MNDTSSRNPILPEMMALAERSVEQAKQSFDDWMAATTRAVSTVEGHTAAAQTNVRQLQRKAVGFAERNVAASFEFAQKLLQARTAEEIGKLHADFISRQVQVLTDQARDMGRQAAKPPDRRGDAA